MNTNTIAVIVGAVGLLVLAGLLIWLALRVRKHQRLNEAEGIRSAAAAETLKVSQREALADETDAKARAAQAEADIKAAQSSGLQQQAAAHRGEAVAARAKLNEQWDRAEELDPAAPTDTTPNSTRKTPQNL